MGLKPVRRVESNLVIELNRGNPANWQYTLDRGSFSDFATGQMVFQNSYGQTLDTWTAVVEDGALNFFAESSLADALPLGTSWTLTADDGDGASMYAQGMVVRNEAPFPNAPAIDPAAQAIQYSYSFGTPGVVTDPVWIRFTGHPQIFDNSGDDLPNAVAAGDLSGTFRPAAMLYYAPLNTESVRATYSIVPGDAGEAWVSFSSKYDATNFVAFRHKKAGTDKLSIAVGSSPLTLVDQASLTHTVAYETFTASYNPTSDTYAIYVGSDTAPLVSWVDVDGVIEHGEGDRYVGMGFKSTNAAPGPEICNWRIADAV